MRRIWVKWGVSFLLCVACLVTVGVPCVAGEGVSLPVVSYGLHVLSAGVDVAVSAPVGNEAVFSEELFARGLNLSRVNSITVSSIPAVTDGELLLGSTRVVAGQTISAENLSYMSFCAASDDVRRASFTFSVNGDATPLVCNVYLLEETNYTPTLATVSELSLKLSTFKGLSAYGTLSAYDPDGDEVIFEVVSYPQNGALRMTDRTLGTYVYTPLEGFVGSDRFSYVARDKYGNYSALETVNVSVALPGTSVTYVDMKGSEAYNAALSLTEAGIMSGTQVGNQYYFYPDIAVSRVEFLVMAMNAAGITEVPDVVSTVFFDDAEIPASMKGYVAAAYEMKYISGTLSQGKPCFLPNESITRAQAAVMLSNIVGLCDVAVTPTFADGRDIPVWATEAIYSLNAAGIMNSDQGYITPTATVTRAQTAQLLSAVMKYVG